MYFSTHAPNEMAYLPPVLARQQYHHSTIVSKKRQHTSAEGCPVVGSGNGAWAVTNLSLSKGSLHVTGCCFAPSPRRGTSLQHGQSPTRTGCLLPAACPLPGLDFHQQVDDDFSGHTSRCWMAIFSNVVAERIQGGLMRLSFL